MASAEKNKKKCESSDEQKESKNKTTSKNKSGQKCAIICQCECKSLKFTISKLPNQVQLCYCTMCQRMHGSVCAAWCPVWENRIQWMTNSTLTNYKSSKNVIRSFCNKCGSNVSLKYLYQNNLVWMCPSMFENQEWFKKENAKILHIFCNDKCPWFKIPNDGHTQLSSGSG